MNLEGQPTTNYVTITREINVLSPTTFVPNIEEIYTALPKINRYNGQTIRPYSVAAHSLMCTFVAENEYLIKEPHLLLAILLHDASEAYIGDIVRPIKYSCSAHLETIERQIMNSILVNVAGLAFCEFTDINNAAFLNKVKEIDSRMAITEIHQLRPDHASKVRLNGHAPFKNLVLPNMEWQHEEAWFKKSYYRLNSLCINQRMVGDANEN